VQGSAEVSKALSLLIGANVKVSQFGIGLQEEEMRHQMKNIGRSKKGMLYCCNVAYQVIWASYFFFHI